MRLEGQIIVYTARVDKIDSLISDTSLDYDIYQEVNDVVIDIYYMFGFMESELREIYDVFYAYNYEFEYIEY
jgi:hypothetical protein